MSREIDALVAQHVMDFKWYGVKQSVPLFLYSDETAKENESKRPVMILADVPAELPDEDGALSLWRVPNYAGDLNACFEAQAKCIERFGASYFADLQSVCASPVGFETLVALTVATAEQRCLAMLACLGVKVPS